MKSLSKRILCSILAVCMLSCFMCASAATEASNYLDGYSASLTARSGGRIIVTVDVDGVGSQDVIGATDIDIFESTDNVSFDLVASYDAEDYPEMLGSGTHYCEDVVTYYGTPGRYYKAYVKFYAEKDGGSDWDDYTTVSCRAIS